MLHDSDNLWLGDFDNYMETLLRDWHAPGIGVSIVRNDQVVLTRGYGYRDVSNSLNFTPSTLFPIASNTKLFTAIAAGLLVDRGLLNFDEPIRNAVPSLRFYDQSLDAAVTLRDMLGHKTGVPRYDMIWHESDYSTKDLFERIRFMKPIAPLRSRIIYNNMMYEAVGHIIELMVGKAWHQFVRDEILVPLSMHRTKFTYGEAKADAQGDYALPFTERRDSAEFWQPPPPKNNECSPAGSIVTSLDDIARWSIMLMNNGLIDGKQVIPASVLHATIAPGLPFPNEMSDELGFEAELNAIYGMGRMTSVFRGHLLTSHGGASRAFHSQVSYLPKERLGVSAFVIGDHCSPLSNAIGFDIYSRALGLEATDWTARLLDFCIKQKDTSREARARSVPRGVPNTKPSHDLIDYVGSYEHPAYGQLRITLDATLLLFHFRTINLPLNHFHYDRFDTADDEANGGWSVSFLTNSLGGIDRATIWLDEVETVFVRLPNYLDADVLIKLVGKYKTPLGGTIDVKLNREGDVLLASVNEPDHVLKPFKGLQFCSSEFPDLTFEFVFEDGCVTALRHWDAHAEVEWPRIDDTVSLAHSKMTKRPFPKG
ncbi:serine hydrolase (plasmid) [Burkholderia gladioli]|uniref:serine hydrolase n=1 Tax=Burkholderia gladioli TaxID=28095 RepID=UPI0019376DF1|nr:serine hydrolase [Burkholderia gladioli]QPQ89133.1 serine hydrolase [Burkholderia gladioli]